MVKSREISVATRHKEARFFLKMLNYILFIATLLIVFALVLLIEVVILQLMRWGSFWECIRSALLMNLASLVVSAILLALVPRFGFYSLAIAFALSTLIEGGVLTWLKRSAWGYNFLVAFCANLASNLVLILPAFYYSQAG